MICVTPSGGTHLWYGPENDHLYKISFIKVYLAARAFTFTASLLFLRQGLVSQVVQDRGYPRVSSSILGCEDGRIRNRQMVHYTQLHVARV